ncbi:AraC family transcriptional regulator [Microbacteriaceae bacterium VKM Ac-2855]|nr:AraC family transcriptional regulator [Microbacteriaceae bacterium VKM Ac-2855]
MKASDYRVAHKISLRGERVRQWLESRCWSAANIVESTIMFGDEIVTDGFAVSRYWFTSLDLTMKSTPASGPWVGATYVIDGAAQVTRVGSAPVDVDSGMMLLRSGPQEHRLSSARPIALIDIQSSWDRLAVHRASTLHEGAVITADPEYVRVMLALLTAILGSSIEPSSVGFGALRAAVESTLAALLLEGGNVAPTGSSAEWSLFQRATVFMEDNLHRSSLDANAIASELGVSRAHLYRAFASAGSSPMKLLRELRAISARTQLVVSGATGGEELAGLAARNGFASPAAMRRAINAHARISAHAFPNRN